MAWSTGYNFYYSGMCVIGSNLYAGTSNTITKTDLATGTIIDSNWATGFRELGYMIASGNTIYICDSGSGAGVGRGEIDSIYSIDTSGVVTPFFNSNLVSSNIQMSTPLGLAIDGGYLYVAVSGSINILKISLTDPLNDYNDHWSDSPSLESPYALCAHNGFIYVGYNKALSPATIYKIDITTQTQTLLGSLQDVAGIATDGNFLYAAEYSGGRILKLSFTGDIINSNWAILSNPDGITINGSYLYAGADSSIYRYSLAGAGPVVCFKDGTLILTDKGYLPIEDLRKGDLVKTLLDGYKPIYMIGKKEIYHPATTERGKDQLYIGTQAEIPWLKEDLIVTGSHCILVDEFKEGEKEETIKVLGKVYATDDKYRLPACVDKRFAVYKPDGNYTVYHLALEHENRVMNYGIYANGLLVETCSKRCIEEYAKMEVIV